MAAKCTTSFITALLICSCYQQVTFTGEILYRHSSFSEATLTYASLTVFPLILNGRFDTTPYLSTTRQIARLKQQRSDLNLFCDSVFASNFAAKYDTAARNSFYADLIEGNTLALQNNDSAWHTFQTRYLLTLRTGQSAKIHSLQQATKRRMQLEAEIWDIDSSEVVWRSRINSESMNSSISDAEFIWQTMCRTFARLPDFRPAINESEW
ncbi:MAG: hypothetical protein GF398_07530 [Chitinivibrionales bacterium]|nr:hypothetical protein [Chitinivibrionales bacterium]